MTKPHHETKATDEQIIERVRECYAADETLSGGGVSATTVADGLPISASTAPKRLADLAERGDLERDWGFTDAGHRLGYRPARDRTVALRDGETRDSGAHADVVDAQLAEADPETLAEIDAEREIRTDGGRASSESDRSDELVYGGVCPVCGDEFTDGFERLEELEGESIEGVRICVIDPPEENLFHLPEDQGDRSTDTDTGREPSESIDCVLCDESSTTPEKHHEHMEEIHDC